MERPKRILKAVTKTTTMKQTKFTKTKSCPFGDSIGLHWPDEEDEAARRKQQIIEKEEEDEEEQNEV